MCSALQPCHVRRLETRPSSPAISLRSEVWVWQLEMEEEGHVPGASSPQNLLHCGSVFKTGSHSASLLGLELIVEQTSLKLAVFLLSQSSGISGMCHHVGPHFDSMCDR